MSDTISGAAALKAAAKAEKGGHTSPSTKDDVFGPGSDPADFHADVVVSYLAGASDEEKRRVIRAEKGGKKRTTVIHG